MELYFAKAGLVSDNDIGIPEVQVKAMDISHWLENRGFQITRSLVTHLSFYDKIEESLARYGVVPSCDMVVDISLRRNKRTKLEVDLASNNPGMVAEVLKGLSQEKPVLSLETPTYKVYRNGGYDFARLEYDDREVRIFSVAQLKKLLNIKH